MHGLTLKVDGAASNKSAAKEAPAKQEEDMTFLDPKDYEGMSQEERNRRTEIMLNKFKHAAAKTQLGT